MAREQWHNIQPWKRRLYLPAYRISEAAHYASTTPQTVSYWHRGGRQGPTLPGRQPRKALSYLQLVEIAVVAAMRKSGFKLSQIRDAREYCAQRLGHEYPFAQYKFKTDGQYLLIDFIDLGAAEDNRDYVEADQGGQATWAEMLDYKLQEFDYENELAVKWHPAGRDKPVFIDPRVAFGAPVVHGVPTWAIRGRWEAGETSEDIAEDFAIEPSLVISALEFEGIREPAANVH